MGKSLAPLLDVLLIVLTVFMVTAAVAIEKMGERERVGPPLRLPKTIQELAAQAGLTQHKSLTVSIKPGKGKNPSFYLGNREVSGPALEEELTTRRPAEVVLRVDGSIPHRHTARLLQLAEKLRFAVSFVTQP